MSYSTCILCRAKEPASRQKIADHIRDGVYLEDEPRYDPSPPTGKLGRLSICFDRRRTPIIMERLENDEAAGAIEEALDATSRARLPEDWGRADAAARCRGDSPKHSACPRCDTLRVRARFPHEDAWTMFDSIENEIIKEGDGILYAYGMGFAARV